MITFSHLSLQYGMRVLFDEVNLTLSSKRRYGIVGANGSGKSSLLKLIAGMEEPTLGEIFISKNSELGWLKQDQYLHENDRILDVVLQGNKNLWRAIEKQKELYNSQEWTDEIGLKIAELEEEIANHGGYEAESFAKKLLIGLGVAERYHEENLSVLSGGFKLRVLLVRTLFTKPDILLLDEPTNYLDIESIAWLEQFLTKEFEGLLLFVSHDQDFLNKLSTHILDIDYGQVRLYTGNYNKFVEEKERVQEQLKKEKQHLDAQVARMRVFIERFKSKPTKARQAMSREKMIEKIEWPDLKNSSRRTPTFKFIASKRAGRRVLIVKNICKSYDNHPILHDVSFEINLHDKVAIIGANGVGKSTILKIAVDVVKADSGSCKWGHGVSWGYFPQDLHELIFGKSTVLSWLGKNVPNKSETELRQALGQCLFSKDDVHKMIHALSGGEMARLVLAKLMLEHHNALVMDEPTNHLDLEGRQALAKALKNFKGTALLVSHDRHFVDACTTRVIHVKHGEVVDFQGHL